MNSTRNRPPEKGPLQDSTAFFETLFEQSPFSMWVSDDKGTMLRMNEACRTMLHVKDEELVGKYNLFADNVVKQQGAMPFVKMVFERGEKAQFALHYNSAHLHSLHLDDTVDAILEVTISPVKNDRNEVLYAIVQHRDVTERMRNEEQLRAVIAGARCLLWHAKVVHKGDRYAWDIHVSNEDAAALLLPVAMQPGMSFTQAWSKSKLAEETLRLESDYLAALEHGKPGYSHEFRCRLADGSTRWLFEDVQIKKRSDTEWDFVGVCTDITERKNAEDKVRTLNEELERRVRERTGQLEAVNKELESFSYSVSHDLRAPLRAIEGFSRILVDDYSPSIPGDGQKLCGAIRAETQRMGQLIDDLLSFSRLSRSDVHSHTINTAVMVEEVLQELLTPEARGRTQLHIGRLPAVVADSGMFRQVWTNLLSNAIKFSSKRPQPRVEIQGAVEDNEAVFSVRDNGAGFDMLYAEKLFGVFERLHSQAEFEGTGVGLAIVQRIVRRHGGHVWAEGKPNAGATFYFTLPVKKDIVEDVPT
jgi:signal transduction histidine kinase